VKECVLATLNRDELVFWTLRFFYFWISHFSVLTPHFGLTLRLNCSMRSSQHGIVLLSFGVYIVSFMRQLEYIISLPERLKC